LSSAIATTDHDEVHAEHDHLALPQHRHHFETEEQQREAGSFGMWLFLLTEIMFFGGMFFAYLLYRNWYYPAFAVASNQLSVPLGAFNTRPYSSLPASVWRSACGLPRCGEKACW
jgi:cytochrome c oxidase subunit 3